MRWRAYLRVSDRRSNCHIPFVLLQPSTRVRNCMFLLYPAAVKIHLGATRAVQHVLGSDNSTGSSAHEIMRNCTLNLLKLGNLICLCPGLSVSYAFCAFTGHSANNYDHGPFPPRSKQRSHVVYRLPRDRSSTAVVIPIGDLSHSAWNGKRETSKVWYMRPPNFDDSAPLEWCMISKAPD